MDDFELGSNDLSNFFSTISSGKKILKEQKESLVGDSFENLFWTQLTENVDKKKEKKKIKSNIIRSNELKEEILIEKKDSNKIENTFTEPNYTESPSSKNKDPLTPLDQDFLTVKAFNQHYKLFLSRIQQQLSTLGGGGETRLEFLDDVDRDSTKTDNYFLKYNATLKKWVGDPADGVGITSIVSVSGITTYYQSTDTDDYIGVTASAPVTIVLPQSPSLGKKLIIKDEGNKINTYNINVQAGIGKSVENDTNVIMDINHQSLTFFYNGTNWFLI